ncbi:Sel1 domain-containing protein [Salinisphaera sp. S4-8]|uniref:tetratricopeptide repeat protein n=1 Tax=Salinisphaera sp. S4-8 TaxID=633357 RepID=UPI00333E62AE
MRAFIFLVGTAFSLCGHAQFDTEAFCVDAEGKQGIEKKSLYLIGERIKAAFSDVLRDRPEISEGFSALPDGYLYHLYLRGLADCYLNGRGVKKDQERAKAFLALAANDGDTLAKTRLASLQLFTADSDLERGGVEAFQRQYEAGSAYAAGQLGWAFALGLSVEKDNEKALELFKTAASRGMTYWQFVLSHAYEQGYFGLEKDEQKSKYWLEYQPKRHIVTYECVVSAYYDKGFFPPNTKVAEEYRSRCDKVINIRTDRQ